jgi:uridine kinase
VSLRLAPAGGDEPEQREKTAVTDLRAAVDKILVARASIPPRRSVLVAVSGIDACGKGHVAARIVEALGAHGVRTAGINVDGWLNLSHLRFAETHPAEHFYLHAIRFDDLFAQLVLPLRDRRSLRLEADHAEETATAYRRHLYEFDDIDVIVLEGILLLKRSFRSYYDVSIWIDCGFDTALERAIGRAQAGLPLEATVNAYRTIYFPAQEIHLQRDDPRAAATLIVENDPRLPRREPAQATRRLVLAGADLFFSTRIRAAARAAGTEVVECSPAELVDACRRAGVDRAILDLHAAGDPLEKVRAVKADPATRGIRVIGYYSHVDDALRRRALEAGLDDVMPRSAFTKKLASLLT